MENGNKTSKPAVNVIIGLIILAGVAVFLIYLFTATSKETKIVISDSSIDIKGMYGDTFSLSDITSVELKDSIPAVITKTNGSGLGELKKGFFKLEGLGECRLFVLSDEGPFVYINNGGKYIIINYKDKSKTEKLYSDLNSKLAK